MEVEIKGTKARELQLVKKTRAATEAAEMRLEKRGRNGERFRK